MSDVTRILGEIEARARIGDTYMSLTYTCELSGTNAFDYLNQLQLHATDVTKFPDRWMPWNYRENIGCISDAT